MTPEQFRAKWRLSYDYPMVAPSYRLRRQEVGEATGLGRKPATAPAPRRSPDREVNRAGFPGGRFA
jgi:predicted transcriptional regulator